MLVNKSQNLLEVKVLLLALYSQVVEGQVNYVHPGQEGKGQVRAGQREREELVGTGPFLSPSQGQSLDILRALVTHGAEEQVEPGGR